MAATTQVDVFHGAGGTASAFPASGRYHKADTTPTTDAATTPVVIPSSGEVFSWRKYTKLNFTTTPTGSITNLRFFGPGSAWATGVNVYVTTSASYTQATSADETAKIASGTNITTYTSASPLTLTAGTVLSNPSTGYGTQPYVVSQLGVSSTASAGTLPTYTLTYRYDET